MKKVTGKVEFSVDLEELYEEEADNLRFTYEDKDYIYYPLYSKWVDLEATNRLNVEGDEQWLDFVVDEDIIDSLNYKLKDYCEQLIYDDFKDWFNDKSTKYFLPTEIEYTYE